MKVVWFGVIKCQKHLDDLKYITSEFAIISSLVLPHTWRLFTRNFSSQLLKKNIWTIKAKNIWTKYSVKIGPDKVLLECERTEDDDA